MEGKGKFRRLIFYFWVFVAEKPIRRLVFLDLRVAGQFLIEAVVRFVIVATAHLSNEDRTGSWHCVEFVVLMRPKRNRFARLQSDIGSGFRQINSSIGMDEHCFFGEPAFTVVLIDFDLQGSAPAVDDVFHLKPMEVERGFHAIPHIKDLLRIGLGVFPGVFLAAVPDRE